MILIEYYFLAVNNLCHRGRAYINVADIKCISCRETFGRKKFILDVNNQQFQLTEDSCRRVLGHMGLSWEDLTEGVCRISHAWDCEGAYE